MAPFGDGVEDAECYRVELTAFCYRYFGSYAEAEDAVQETMLRAWQRGDGFEGRSSLRTWLYRIATNVCLDMRRAPQRRSLPMDLTSAGRVPDDPRTLTTLPEATWVGPIADAHLPVDPADATVQRDSVRLAFVVALQTLPPRQRVVLLLREVLAWSAAECAALLEMTVASVNSLLARARRTLSSLDVPAAAPADPRLLMNYVSAFEAYDVDRLVSLLTEDATFSMPPYSLWLRGVGSIEQWWHGPGTVCRGSRTVVTAANGAPAVAVYHPVSASHWEPFALHVLTCADGRIAGITHFMGAAVFAQFGLPAALGR